MTAFSNNLYRSRLASIDPISFYGTVSQVIGLMIESIGPMAKIGDLCLIHSYDRTSSVTAEVVGFRESRILLMPFGKLVGIGPGSKVDALGRSLRVPVGMNLRGRIIDGLGNPIDDLGPLQADDLYPIDNPPPNPLTRNRIQDPLPLGVKAIDGLITCGRGQRIGIFSGSGVGKSTLLGMIARNAQADINVITLVGERGREVREFVEKDLRPEGLAKSVVIVATSDQPAIIRQKSALLGTAVAEYFREQGMNVMLLMDSLTRFAMAQREIGMAIGEPPVSRGYTPSVFNVLPRLLERTGTSAQGSITGLYTVLVEGDDMNEPVADTVRGILDGHIVLSRNLAHRNHYPAIDVLASVSRIMPDIVTPGHLANAGFLRKHLSIYREAQDLINIGAYKPGANAEIDTAVALQPLIKQFLCQGVHDQTDYHTIVAQMKKIEEATG
ncbi:MAG: flagellar protein export ATPase FliI [Firmicutes bacterium]|nr:flagellar protein export ATPase FliI [Bacillota bacterium]